MHIGLLVADLSPYHGWGQYSINLARSLVRAGVRVSIVAARNSPDVVGWEIKRLLPSLVPRARGMPLRLWLTRGSVQQALRGCDLIHATVEPYALLAGWCAGRRPYFITGHGSYVNSLMKLSGIRGLLYRRAFSGAARVICVSRYTEEQYRLQVPDSPSCVIPNGVDSARFVALRSAPSTDQAPTVLAVGAVKPRKGILPLVEAIAVARKAIPELQCVIIGETSSNPDYVARVRACIEQHSLSNSVVLTGSVNEETLLAHYASADLFCLPTIQVNDDFEGYGLVYLEAGLAGLPVIATDAGGVGDVVEDGVNGLLIPATTMAERLPAAIVSLMRDRELARKFGENGRERALSLSWDAIAQRYLDVYEKELRLSSIACDFVCTI